MSNVIALKTNHGPEISDFLNSVKAGIIDFGILAYRFPSGATDIISISHHDIPDDDIIELLEHLIESIRHPQELTIGG